MHPHLIHNHAIRYFHMVAAQTFFGKAKNIGPISKEEVFLMFSIFQSRSVYFVSFLMADLDKVAI